MAKTHKTITLCQETREIAENLVNFSAFVRECLEAYQVGGSYAQMQQLIHLYMAVGRKLAYEVHDLEMELAEDDQKNFIQRPEQIFNHTIRIVRKEMK